MIDTLTVTILVALSAAGIGLLGYWAAVGYHVARTMALIPTARHALRIGLPAEDPPRVCILVPAHNEQACIGTLAASLCAQDYPPDRLSMVFVLDRCTDGTRARLEQALRDGGGLGRAEIIELNACSPGWIGKPHALWSGFRGSTAAANADLLLFVDADTHLDPRLIRAATALLLNRRLGMLSLLSTLTYDHWFETIVQPAAGMELMRQFPVVKANGGGAPDRRAGSRKRRPFANGQFIMIRRADYEAIGGHESVRAIVLEDVELARRADKSGIACGFFLDGGLLTCRMYDSFAALKRGWKRIFTEAANTKPHRLRKLARRTRLVGTALPLLTLCGLFAGLWLRTGVHALPATIAAVSCALGLLVWAGVLAWSYAIGRIPLWGLIGFPLGSWITGGIMREAARDLERGRPTEWGGMSIARTAR